MAMPITDSFRNAVSSGNVMGVRIMMKNGLLTDPTFTEFNEMGKLAGNMSGLYDTHDGRELNGDKSAWNDDYMNKLMVQVVDNFSHERLNHLKDVVRCRRPPAANSKPPSTKSGAYYSKKDNPNGTTSTENQGRRTQDYRGSRTASNRNAKIAGGAVAGGVLGGAISGIAGGSIIIGAAAGAVVVGAVVAVVASGE